MIIYNKDGTIHSEDFNFAGGTHKRYAIFYVVLANQFS